MLPGHSSYCASGTTVTFHWRRYDHTSRAIDEALDSLEEAVFGKEGRLRNPYMVGTARGVFRAILERAEIGALEDPDEVRRIVRPTPGRMFEFRWNDIVVLEMHAGVQRRLTVPVRLLEIEASIRPNEALGLRAFEKDTAGSPDEIRVAQNHEIDLASRAFTALITDQPHSQK